MIPLVVENHPHRSLADSRRKLVCRLAHTGSTFSGVGASGKPDAVQLAVAERKTILRIGRARVSETPYVVNHDLKQPTRFDIICTPSAFWTCDEF
jgi:hypothetical protein